jgi:hypothetical protein
MPVQTRSQIAKLSQVQSIPVIAKKQILSGYALPNPIMPKVSDVVFQSIGEMFIPELTNFIFFKKRISFMLSSINELDAQLDEAYRLSVYFESIGNMDAKAGSESNKRTVRFNKLRLVAELFFFINLYYPEVHQSILSNSKNLRLLTSMIAKIEELKRDIGATHNQPITRTEIHTINTLEIALDMCEKTLYPLNI